MSWGALGVGGMFSSVAGAYLTQYYHPKYTYLIYSVYGLIVMFLGINLSKDDESTEDDADSLKKSSEKNNSSPQSFSHHFKLSLDQIK